MHTHTHTHAHTLTNTFGKVISINPPGAHRPTRAWFKKRSGYPKEINPSEKCQAAPNDNISTLRQNADGTFVVSCSQLQTAFQL